MSNIAENVYRICENARTISDVAELVGQFTYEKEYLRVFPDILKDKLNDVAHTLTNQALQGNLPGRFDAPRGAGREHLEFETAVAEWAKACKKLDMSKTEAEFLRIARITPSNREPVCQAKAQHERELKQAKDEYEEQLKKCKELYDQKVGLMRADHKARLDELFSKI